MLLLFLIAMATAKKYGEGAETRLKHYATLKEMHIMTGPLVKNPGDWDEHAGPGVANFTLGDLTGLKPAPSTDVETAFDRLSNGLIRIMSNSDKKSESGALQGSMIVEQMVDGPMEDLGISEASGCENGKTPPLDGYYRKLFNGIYHTESNGETSTMNVGIHYDEERNIDALVIGFSNNPRQQTELFFLDPEALIQEPIGILVMKKLEDGNYKNYPDLRKMFANSSENN